MISIPQTHNELRLTASLNHLDTGAANAKLRVYSGVRPANGAAITTQTLLVEILLDKPCGVVASNVLTLSSADTPLAAATGTATWGRIINGAGIAAIDCDVSLSGGSGDIQLVSTSILAGGSAQLASGTLG